MHIPCRMWPPQVECPRYKPFSEFTSMVPPFSRELPDCLVHNNWARFSFVRIHHHAHVQITLLGCNVGGLVPCLRVALLEFGWYIWCPCGLDIGIFVECSGLHFVPVSSPWLFSPYNGFWLLILGMGTKGWVAKARRKTMKKTNSYFCSRLQRGKLHMWIYIYG